MNIRQAILKAAASIEKNPDRFSFMSTDIPDCGTPGCVLGWVGFHLKVPTDQDEDRYHLVVAKALGFTCDDTCPILHEDTPFYDRMDSIGRINWRRDAGDCAKTLRKYADKYHPETDHIPASVRKIFEPQQVAA